MSNCTKLILIRHGQTDSNLEKRYSGFSDPCLNNQGIKECENLSLKLKDITVDKIYSSDLKRAFQSANLIFKNNNKIETEKDFREMNFGIFEDLTYKEIMEKNAKEYNDWLDNMLEYKIPKGESMFEFKHRIMSKLDFILTLNKNKVVCLVAHAGVIRVILSDILGYGMDKFWEIKQENCSLNIIEFKGGKSCICFA